MKVDYLGSAEDRASLLFLELSSVAALTVLKSDELIIHLPC